MAISDDKRTEVSHQDYAPEQDMDSSKGKNDGDDSPVEVTQNMAEARPITLVQCLKKYKYASFICVLASIGALSDGYQVQMSGSIIALPGFIRQFGDLQENGQYVINPQYISLWGCEFWPIRFESFQAIRC